MCAEWVEIERVDRNYHSWFKRCQSLQSNAESSFIVSQSLVFRKDLRDQILQNVMVLETGLEKNIVVKEAIENLCNSLLE